MDRWHSFVYVLGALIAVSPYVLHWARKLGLRSVRPSEALLGERVTLAGTFRAREGSVDDVHLASVKNWGDARDGDAVYATGVLVPRAGSEGALYRERALGFALEGARVLPRKARFVWRGPIRGVAFVLVVMGVVAVFAGPTVVSSGPFPVANQFS